MRLVSFQVRECFGFRDSGEVNVQDSSNLIYVLGRNSSGKTAFLSALAHFSPKRTPQNDSRFLNFDPSGRPAQLIAQFAVSDGDLPIQALVQDFAQTLRLVVQGDHALSSSSEFRKYLEEISTGLTKEYATLVEAALAAGTLWVKRTGSGEYHYSANSEFTDTTTFEQRIKAILDKALAPLRPQNPPGANQVLAAGGWRVMAPPTVEQVNHRIAYQLPGIDWLSGKQSVLPLDGDLPDRITVDHLAGNQPPVIEAFIELLGREKVREVLTTDNFKRRRSLEHELQELVNKLTAIINHSEVGVQDLIQMDLDRAEGLQISFVANGKQSFYRQVSDNTKFLFAYYLYRAVNKLRGSILLFDEPSNGFHATAQEQLLNFLLALGREGNLVIVSTHSEHLIDPDHLTGIRLMDADDQGYLKVLNRWYDHPKGDGDFLSLHPVLDAIGLKYGSNKLTIHDNVIVVEGVSDLAYLRAFRQVIGCKEDLHIAPARGADTIPHVVALVISQGLHFKVVLDQELTREGAKAKLVDGYGIPQNYLFEVPIPEFYTTKATGAGIEDIFSKADFAALLTEVGFPPESDFEHMTNSMYVNTKRRKKLKSLIADWFLQHIGNYQESDFDPETNANMRTLMEFCMGDNWFMK